MFHHSSYLLLDAARMDYLINEAEGINPTRKSLYIEDKTEFLNGVAPYIFQFAYSTPFANWFLKRGWGNAWGLLIKSSWPLSELQKHFRKFLIVKIRNGEELYFRFYDPRVLRIFLPIFKPNQLREFFGEAIQTLLMEDEDPEFAIQFRLENSILKTERFPVADIIAALPEPQLQVAQDRSISQELSTTSKDSHTEKMNEKQATLAQAQHDAIVKTDQPAVTGNKSVSKWKPFE